MPSTAVAPLKSKGKIVAFCNVHWYSVYRSRKIRSWVNSEGVTLQRKPFAKKHWIDRNEAVDIQWKISIKITTKSCQSAPAETCLDNSARNTAPPQKMEEEYFARVSEWREAASPFTLNCCARDIYRPCKNPPATLSFWFTAEKAERNADRICSAALCFSRLVLLLSASTTFEKPENGSHL